MKFTKDLLRNHSITRRSFMIMSGQAGLLSILVSKMLYMQIVDAKKYHILSEKNKLSQFWRKKGSFIEEEHEILHQLVPKVLQEYKLRYISYLISQAEQGIRKASENHDDEGVNEFQKRYQKLKTVEGLLCGHLGKRTITS